MLHRRSKRHHHHDTRPRGQYNKHTPRQHKKAYGREWSSTPLKNSIASFEIGSTVWVPVDNDDAWEVGEVIGIDENNSIIIRLNQTNNTEKNDVEVTIPKDCPIYPVSRAYGREDVDDLTSLKHLHEPALLQVLQNRFNRDELYTMCGPILLAVNPFKAIPGLYEKHVVDKFLKDADDLVHTPHVFSTALQAYRGMCGESSVRQGVSQSILISGESGAGKTETTKLVMQFLSACGRAFKGDINRQVLESNPLLEAFGNACTLRNDNSSRFGKFIQLQFDGEKDHLKLKGARIETYLLEKIRVTNQIQGERNFHIFYQICAAAAVSRRMRDGDGEEKCIYTYPQILGGAEGTKKMDIELRGLSDHACFSYLTRDTAVHKLSHGEDLEGFERTVHAMTVIGYGKDGIEHIFRMAAAILRLGNVEFAAPDGDSESSIVINKDELQMACDLLELDSELMERSLCSKSYNAVDDHCVIPLPVEKAIEQRDALARFLYGLVFTRVVVKTNSACVTSTPSTNERCRRQSVASSLADFTDDGSLFCGVLDIFGFEYYRNNTFEQLCINYANERLQGFFVDYVFNHEQQVYHKDGIHWESVVLDYPDNQASIALLDGRPNGLLTLLDEECKVVGGSDDNYFGKIAKSHSHTKKGEVDLKNLNHRSRRMFEVVKQKKVSFIVSHFAGPVEYSCEQFLDKNRDAMSNDLVTALATNKELRRGLRTFRSDSNMSLPSMAAGGGAPPPRKRQKLYTVAGEFREQLSSLMTVLKETNPHFIRCIKPNQKNLPNRFERCSVVDQLRYGGVIQAVEVARNGYPVRIGLSDFAQDYWPVLANGMEGCEYRKDVRDLKDRIRASMEILAKEIESDKDVKEFLFLVGNSKVFLKRPAYEHLNYMLHCKRSIKACQIQAVWRGMKQRKEMVRVKAALVKLQRAAKRYIIRIRERRRVAAIAIQSWLRKIIATRGYNKWRSSVRYSVKVIESYWARVLEERRRMVDIDQLETLSAVNSPSMEKTENSPINANDVTRITGGPVPNDDLLSAFAIRPYRLSTGSLSSCHSMPCYDSMCIDSGGKCRPAGGTATRRLSVASSSGGSSSSSNRMDTIQKVNEVDSRRGGYIRCDQVTKMRTPSLSARSVAASPPSLLAHTPTRGFGGSPPRLGAAPPRRFRESAVNFGFPRPGTPLLAHQRIRSLPHPGGASMHIVQGSIAKHVPMTALGSLVSPTALSHRSRTPSFFGPSRPLRAAESISLASPPPITLHKQSQFIPPFSPPPPTGVTFRPTKQQAAGSFGPPTAYHQQRTAIATSCNNGQHNFRQRLRVPKVPSFNLRTFTEGASSSSRTGQQQAKQQQQSRGGGGAGPTTAMQAFHPPTCSNAAAANSRPVSGSVPWMPPSINRNANSIEEWARLQIRAAKRISPGCEEQESISSYATATND
ncbi:hypothetical protein FOL47_004572 [Perkinsus chesapeaki]|uniref:Myosin motor domain-containing protein n=1 Tax=Perkinsus chesapeaki TaxID=330153 RepID=A0A7J6MZ15_PERCH|nr:hypothetical protein FOL47_004572 [Perkinsus chesapeaki]